jgi:hypothetical protein
MSSNQRIVIVALLFLTTPFWQHSSAAAAPPEPAPEPNRRASTPARASAAVQPEVLKLPLKPQVRIPAAACTLCPDLTPGTCQIVCSVGTHNAVAVCASDGYRSDFGFQVTLPAGVRNNSANAATIPAGKRLYAVSGPKLGGFTAPSTGLFIGAGAASPQKPAVQLSRMAPGSYSIRFEVDPDQAVAETDESNNAIDCPLTVIDAATAPKYPDLVLEPISVEPASGTQQTAFKVRATVRNIGSGWSSGGLVRCEPGVTNLFGSLAPGAEFRAGGFVQNVASLPPGTHAVTCELKTDDPERTQEQHSRTATLTVQ